MTYFELDRLEPRELHELIEAYDKYIQEANDDDRYVTGWKPVCIAEFYDNEFQEMGAKK